MERILPPLVLSKLRALLWSTNQHQIWHNDPPAHILPYFMKLQVGHMSGRLVPVRKSTNVPVVEFNYGNIEEITTK